MDIDPDLSKWALEFILKLPLEDRTLNSLLRIFTPPNNNLNLQKMILLKKLESLVSHNSISDSSLELLEQLEEIEFRLGHEIASDAIKHAYCAVAVECTMKHMLLKSDLQNHRKYFFGAVKKVWRGRIQRMKNVLGMGGLCSEELWGWKDEIEAAVWDDSVCESVVKKSESVNAIQAITTYLREEKEKLGYSFIEVVAARVKDDNILQEMLGVKDIDQGFGKDAISSSPDHGGKINDDRVEEGKETNHSKNNSVSLKRSRGHASGSPRGVIISDTDDLPLRKQFRNYNLSHSAEVNEVREALKSSSMELKTIVTDPFPSALRLAEEISDMARKTKANDHAEEHQNETNMFIGGSAGVVQATNCGDVPRSSLVARNRSAHTYEWDGSLDDSPEDSPNRSSRPQLPSPRRVHASPLKKYEPKKLNGRRRWRKWSSLEEDTLMAGVKKYGKGNWKVILTAYPDIFEDRTDVDLKDKWRNLTR